ncbi:MAG TPA: GtrA family protein [Candidatus Paceibacterota bacterium]
MIEEKYQSLVLILAYHFPKIFKLAFPFRKIIKYLISGSIATLSTLITLYFCTDFLNIWYVASSAIASAVGIAVSFFFQKFWTFRDKSVDRIKSQALYYTVVMVTSIGLNALGIFLIVHYVRLHYLLAQIIVSGLIAVVSFFVYGRLIFKRV